MVKRYDPFRSKMTTSRRTISWIDRRSGDTIGKPYKPKKIKFGTTYKPRKSTTSTRKQTKRPQSRVAKNGYGVFGAHQYTTSQEVEEYDDAAFKEKFREAYKMICDEDIMTKEMQCIKEKGCRYLLQTLHAVKPLFVIGANPSIADETRDDPTVRVIKKIAAANGFDGVVILNLYPLICTDPNGLPQEPDVAVHKGNLQVVEGAILNCKVMGVEGPITVWCAWGDLMEKRAYLKNYAEEILKSFPNDTRFVCVGETKRGNPSHPLYHKVNSKLIRYKM